MNRALRERKRRNRGPRQGGLTPEQRAEFARARRKLVGKIITQKGWEGALVLEHIRGSQYLVRLPDGKEVFASHKKSKSSTSTGGMLQPREGVWAIWESRG